MLETLGRESGEVCFSGPWDLQHFRDVAIKVDVTITDWFMWANIILFSCCWECWRYKWTSQERTRYAKLISRCFYSVCSFSFYALSSLDSSFVLDYR